MITMDGWLAQFSNGPSFDLIRSSQRKTKTMNFEKRKERKGLLYVRRLNARILSKHVVKSSWAAFLAFCCMGGTGATDVGSPGHNTFGPVYRHTHTDQWRKTIETLIARLSNGAEDQCVCGSIKGFQSLANADWTVLLTQPMSQFQFLTELQGRCPTSSFSPPNFNSFLFITLALCFKLTIFKCSRDSVTNLETLSQLCMYTCTANLKHLVWQRWKLLAHIFDTFPHH